MIRYKKTTASIALVTMLLTSSIAEEIDNSKNMPKTDNSLKALASKVKGLSTQELNELGALIGIENKPEHTHKQSSKKNSSSKKTIEKVAKEKPLSVDEEKKSKIKKLLMALGGLAQKEGTESACTFCSAILKDVMVNKVQVVDMAQDWVQVKIKKGDSLAKLSQKYYGNGQAFKMIANLNKDTLGKNNTIYAGKVITIPRPESIKEKSQQGKLSCKFCAALLADSSLNRIKILKVHEDYTEIKIKTGDMLSALALRYYGKSSEYHKIYEANKDKIGKNYLIFPGMVLKIPHAH